jgi:hypothetical protein
MVKVSFLFFLSMGKKENRPVTLHGRNKMNDGVKPGDRTPIAFPTTNTRKKKREFRNFVKEVKEVE